MKDVDCNLLPISNDKKLYRGSLLSNKEIEKK